MKATTIIISLALTASAFARLGDSPEQCAKRYGEPVYSSSKRNPIYSTHRKSGYEIEINYSEEKAVLMEIRQFGGKRLTPDQVRALLKFVWPESEWQDAGSGSWSSRHALARVDKDTMTIHVLPELPPEPVKPEPGKVSVSIAEFKSDPKPAVTITLANGTNRAVSSVAMRLNLQTPGRQVPWFSESFAFGIAGGLEPGETGTFNITDKINPGKFDLVPKEGGAEPHLSHLEAYDVNGEEIRPAKGTP